MTNLCLWWDPAALMRPQVRAPRQASRNFRALQDFDVPGQTQRTKHGDAGHEIIVGTAVIEEPNHDITLRSDGISNRAAMAARSKDQPTVWHQP
jgi:hypothetical protein